MLYYVGNIYQYQQCMCSCVFSCLTKLGEEFLQCCLKCTPEYLFPFFKHGCFLCTNILFKTHYSTKSSGVRSEISYNNQ